MGDRVGFGDLAKWAGDGGHRTSLGRYLTKDWWRNILSNPLTCGYVAYKRKQMRTEGGAELLKGVALGPLAPTAELRRPFVLLARSLYFPSERRAELQTDHAAVVLRLGRELLPADSWATLLRISASDPFDRPALIEFDDALLGPSLLRTTGPMPPEPSEYLAMAAPPRSPGQRCL